MAWKLNSSRKKERNKKKKIAETRNETNAKCVLFRCLVWGVLFSFELRLKWIGLVYLFLFNFSFYLGILKFQIYTFCLSIKR